MTRKLNQKLRSAAERSALRHSTTPLFLCGDNMLLCMYSDSMSGIAPSLVAGKDMTYAFSEDIPEMLRHVPERCVEVPVQLPDYNDHAFAVKGSFDGEDYFAFILSRTEAYPWRVERNYIARAAEQIADTVDELLHTGGTDAAKLSFACSRMIRLLRAAQLTGDTALTDSMLLHPHTELIPYLNTVCAEFSDRLATVGGSIGFIREDTRVFQCGCPPMCFGSILVPLITAAVCRSADGVIRLACEDDPDDYRRASVSIIVPTPRESSPVTGFDDLVDRMSIMKLDLMAVQDIADYYGVELDCRTDSDGSLVMGLTCTYTHPGDIVFHSPHLTEDTLFVIRLVGQLCAAVPLELAENGRI